MNGGEDGGGWVASHARSQKGWAHRVKGLGIGSFGGSLL